MLQALDTFVLMGAGSDESCRAALEAMAAGRPVVARRIGALPEAVEHGSPVCWWTTSDPESVEAALATLAGDPERARRMGEAGRHRAVETFSPEHHAEEVEAIYLEILARRSRALVEDSSPHVVPGMVLGCLLGGSPERGAGARRSSTSSSPAAAAPRTRVIEKARAAGARRIETLKLRRGLKPASDAADVKRLREWLPEIDVVHAHRGKEHWLAAVANRLVEDTAAPRAHPSHRAARAGPRAEPMAVPEGHGPRPSR